MGINGEMRRNVTAEDTQVYGRSGRRPLHVFSDTDGGAGGTVGCI